MASINNNYGLISDLSSSKASNSNIISSKPDIPKFKDIIISDTNNKLINKIENKALKVAYKLLTKVYGTDIQIATSESLTAGLIMSTLVKIPWAGWHKYGCFGVYDTDAKRVFNSVEVDDVYTHTCAKEMAIGLLKNSNATLAIVVTGNAMPYKTDLEKLGEVFIGIAGYKSETEIIYTTKSINSCFGKSQNTIYKQCRNWIKNHDDSKYPSRNDTAAISLLIRYYTTYYVLLECIKFVDSNKLYSPSFITKQKEDNKSINGECYHNNIPDPKYPNIGQLKITCTNTKDNCELSNSCIRLGTKTINLAKLKGGGRYNKKTCKK